MKGTVVGGLEELGCVDGPWHMALLAGQKEIKTAILLRLDMTAPRLERANIKPIIGRAIRFLNSMEADNSTWSPSELKITIATQVQPPTNSFSISIAKTESSLRFGLTAASV